MKGELIYWKSDQELPIVRVTVLESEGQSKEGNISEWKEGCTDQGNIYVHGIGQISIMDRDEQILRTVERTNVHSYTQRKIENTALYLPFHKMH